MRNLAVATTFLLLTAAPALAQAPVATDGAVAAELAKLNLTLKEIETLLRRQGESDELGLLIQRVELAGARLAEQERALETAESERRSLDRRKGQLELRLTLMAAELERAESDLPADEVEATIAHVEAQLRLIRHRATELADEIAQLESTVASQSADLQAWQSILDRRLGGR